MKRYDWGAVRRKTPYTAIGVRRLQCARCSEPAEHQWRICSDRHAFRPICTSCDIALNDMVLRWMNHPDAEILISEYRTKMEQR